MSGKLIFLLGGARSGKTEQAQRLAAELGGEVTYVATAEAGDEEMRGRIAAHRAARPAGWQTMERPLRLGDVLTEWDASVVVVDCLTLLVSNILSDAGSPLGSGVSPASPEGPRGEHAPAALVEARVEEELNELLAAWKDAQFHLIVVSNEVGLGLVPDNALGRVYRDALGRANQRMAQAADEVYFMVAGLAVKIK
jgi:adenosylcobinamide kinase / adenosylcobinamide-phosphate guanylyltransferase